MSWLKLLVTVELVFVSGLFAEGARGSGPEDGEASGAVALVAPLFEAEEAASWSSGGKRTESDWDNGRSLAMSSGSLAAYLLIITSKHGAAGDVQSVSVSTGQLLKLKHVYTHILFIRGMLSEYAYYGAAL